jgi:hypothetical protein
MYNSGMSSITIQKVKIEKEKGVVVLPILEYKKLLQQSIPTHYLYGKDAEKLDRLVEEGLKEYKAGKTKKIKSLSDLD